MISFVRFATSWMDGASSKFSAISIAFVFRLVWLLAFFMYDLVVCFLFFHLLFQHVFSLLLELFDEQAELFVRFAPLLSLFGSC
jgi:hypothetical protein